MGDSRGQETLGGGSLGGLETMVEQAKGGGSDEGLARWGEVWPQGGGERPMVGEEEMVRGRAGRDLRHLRDSRGQEMQSGGSLVGGRRRRKEVDGSFRGGREEDGFDREGGGE